MRLDRVSLGPLPEAVADEVRAAEAAGYAGWFTAETGHDAFVLSALAATTTTRVEVGTAIAVAFARNPMDVAYSANDCQRLARGRFVLGLGSQVGAHIRRRFSMPWSEPAARMREFVLALRAIWANWHEGTPLRFEGDHYTHTLMSPFFAPPAHPYGTPPVLLAAVGPRMTEVAGEVADGVLCHAFTTERYLRDHTLPALRRGARRAGRDPAEVTVALGSFVVTGDDDAAVATCDRAVRSQIAFYASTPAYLPVLEAHGWGWLHEQLHGMSRRGEWEAMADLIDDEMLDAFAVVAPPHEVGTRLVERFGDVVDRISLYGPYEYDDAGRARLRDQLGA